MVSQRPSPWRREPPRHARLPAPPVAPGHAPLSGVVAVAVWEQWLGAAAELAAGEGAARFRMGCSATARRHRGPLGQRLLLVGQPRSRRRPRVGDGVCGDVFCGHARVAARRRSRGGGVPTRLVRGVSSSRGAGAPRRARRQGPRGSINGRHSGAHRRRSARSFSVLLFPLLCCFHRRCHACILCFHCIASFAHPIRLHRWSLLLFLQRLKRTTAAARSCRSSPLSAKSE